MDIVNYVRETRSGEQEPQTMTEKILRDPWAQIYGEKATDLRECPLCGAIVERGSVSLHGAYHLNQ